MVTAHSCTAGAWSHLMIQWLLLFVHVIAPVARVVGTQCDLGARSLLKCVWLSWGNGSFTVLPKIVKNPVISWTVWMISWRVFLCSTLKLRNHTQTVAQDIIDCATIERHKAMLRDISLPEDYQKIMSLLGHLHQLCCVQSPGQVLTCTLWKRKSDTLLTIPLDVVSVFLKSTTCFLS